MADDIARRIVIEGRVQRVGYRDWMVATARGLGLVGWVRNRRDGAVEALVGGPSDAVDALLKACLRGPPAAQVSAITHEPDDHPGTDGFHRVPTA